MQLRDPEPLKDRQAVHTSSSQGYAGQGPRPAFERASCPAANTRSSRALFPGRVPAEPVASGRRPALSSCRHRMQSLTILEDPMTVEWDDVS
jgi:hypothetical protein